MSYNWEAMGIAWTTGPVSRQHGANGSDRRVVGTAQIPTLVNIDKAVAANLTGALLKGVNGTSWRVLAQDVCRALLEKGYKDVEGTRTRVYARLLSIRQGGTTTVQYVDRVVEKEVVRQMLPDGTEFVGDDEMEFRQAVISSLIDMGVEAAKAVKIGQTTAWKGKAPTVEDGPVVVSTDPNLNPPERYEDTLEDAVVPLSDVEDEELDEVDENDE